MHLSESVYFTVQSWTTAFELWKKLSETYEKKVASTKMYLIRRLYNLRMKDSDAVQAHLNEYESLRSQISSQGTIIEDELRAIEDELKATLLGNFCLHLKKQRRKKKNKEFASHYVWSKPARCTLFL